MNTTPEYHDPYPFDDFAPTLSQCYVLVTLGYLLSRSEILTAGDVKGIISLATYFAMPGIICVSLMDADFSDFRWELLFGVFLGKFFTFVVVAGFWVWMMGNIGVAGVVALFCTQSNDLPVGNPLMSSLYGDYRPQMMKYLFLIPAMTVIFFVPFTNIMLSVYRKMRKKIISGELDVGECWWKHIQGEDVLSEARGIIRSPVVIATISGLILNFALKEGAPEILHQPIKVAAATIPGVALLILGFSFVRKERYLLSSAVVPATVLFVLKMVITPIMLHGILRMMTEESKASSLLSDFALLYGIVSPATAVFMTGQEFRKAFAVMSVALIFTSLTCFPVSYVVARATIAPVQKLSTYVPALKRISFWTACISIGCNVVSGVIIMWKSQWQQTSSYILYLLFTQIITCSGLLIWCATEREAWTIYCEIVLYHGGEISGYLWTGILAVVLVSKDKKWLMDKKSFIIILCTAISVSTIIITAMCFLIPHNADQTMHIIRGARSGFELIQLTMTSILLFLSLVVVVGCLTCYFKRSGKTERQFTEGCAYYNTVFYIENPEEITQTQCSKEVSWVEKIQETSKERDEVTMCREENVKNGEFMNSPSFEEREWTFRLSSLLILLSLTMLMRFIANLFKLLQSKSLEVMVPMEFLQSTLFTGQGIFTFLTFGIDVRVIIIRLRKWCRKIHGDDNVVTHCKEKNTTHEDEIEKFCNQFCKFYYSRCFTDIAKDRKWKDTVYRNSFWGHQLVDWLITEGLSLDDVDAEGQGQKLMEAGVIQHVSQKYYFYDAPHLYQFVKGNLAQRKNCKPV